MPGSRDCEHQVDKGLCLKLLGVRSAREPIAFKFLSDVLDFPVRFPWSTKQDSKGRIYFIHCETKRTSWEHPYSNILRELEIVAVRLEPTEEFHEFIEDELDRLNSNVAQSETHISATGMKRYGLSLLSSREYVSNLFCVSSSPASIIDTEESFFIQTFSPVDLGAITESAVVASEKTIDSTSYPGSPKTKDDASSARRPSLSVVQIRPTVLGQSLDDWLNTSRQITRRLRPAQTSARVEFVKACPEPVQQTEYGDHAQNFSNGPQIALEQAAALTDVTLLPDDPQTSDHSECLYYSVEIEMSSSKPFQTSGRFEPSDAPPESLVSSPHRLAEPRLVPEQKPPWTKLSKVYGRRVRKAVMRTENYLKLRQVDVMRRALSR